MIQTLTGSKPKLHADILLKHGYLTLRNQFLIRIMLKINSGDVPDCISSLFKTNNSASDHNTGANTHLYKQKSNCAAMYKTFPYQRIYIWNIDV